MLAVFRLKSVTYICIFELTMLKTNNSCHFGGFRVDCILINKRALQLKTKQKCVANFFGRNKGSCSAKSHFWGLRMVFLIWLFCKQGKKVLQVYKKKMLVLLQYHFIFQYVSMENRIFMSGENAAKQINGEKNIKKIKSQEQAYHQYALALI